MAKSIGTNYDFRTLSELVPKKSYIKKPMHDTSSVTVDTGDAESIGSPVPFPEKRPPVRARESVSYSPRHSLINDVTLEAWPGNFSFYSKFHFEAVKLFPVEGKPCPPERFFAYTPQYEQLSQCQLEYYLYFRTLVRGGEYPAVDSSYIFLLLYEIINLPELIPAEKGAEMIVRLWKAYRGTYPYLDKYIGEWLCDYCLIHRLPPPVSVADFCGEVIQKLSFPEFYEDPQSDAFSFESVARFSSCDYKKSRFYDANRTEYDRHIPAAATLAVKAFLSGDVPQGFLIVSHDLRDSFPGAVAYVGVKYKIKITSLSLRKSREYHQLCSTVIKACENELRAAKGIKSRYSAQSLPEICRTAIAEYFDGFYPDRRAKRKADTSDDDAPYMRYYMPRRIGSADIGRAMRIEKSAWKTAMLLESETEETPVPETHGAPPSPQSGEAARRESEAPAGEVGNDILSLLLSLDETLAKAIAAAVGGEMKTYCKEHSIMPEEAERLINEAAFDFTGDILIDETFGIPEEYKDDTKKALDTAHISYKEEK